MNRTVFGELGLNEPLLAAVRAAGYTHPTEIQIAAIPVALTGRDLVASAQTGTGKTAAFALPILQRLTGGSAATARRPRALILTPTRELAQQIEASLRVYGRGLSLRAGVVVGGVGQEPQVATLRRGCDILVATPGRLLDLVDQGHVSFDNVEIFVLDEADRMLDMGFIHTVRHLASLLPKRRQTLFFSATMPLQVARLANDLLRDPQTIAVAPPAAVAGGIDQRVYFVAKADKRALLVDLLATREVTRALVFTRTKHGADRLVKQLGQAGLSCGAIHANKSQGARQQALAAFGAGRVKILVATDIVARGIDIESISHVVNFELPAEPENYVHRIGRTARAEASGTAVAFCDVEELSLLRGIERLTRDPLTVVIDHPYHDETIAACFLGQRENLKSAPRRGGYRSFRGPNGRRAAMR